MLAFELVGLYSFRLIGHYMDRMWAMRGAYIAVCTNRVADLLLLLLLSRLYGSATMFYPAEC